MEQQYACINKLMLHNVKERIKELSSQFIKDKRVNIQQVGDCIIKLHSAFITMHNECINSETKEKNAIIKLNIAKLNMLFNSIYVLYKIVEGRDMSNIRNLEACVTNVINMFDSLFIM